MATTGDYGGCYAVAGHAIHAGCQLEAYQTMAALIIGGLATPADALNYMVAEGQCPTVTNTRVVGGGGSGGIQQGQ